MDAKNKRAFLTDQRKRWMEDRQNSILQNESYNQTKSEMNRHNETRVEAKSSCRGSDNTAIAQAHPRALTDESDLLNKLTEKITRQIRRDVKDEINNNLNSQDMRDAMAEKMDRYLEAELHTHTCKICYELMTSPKNTPMLLFPCGHTFCCECVNKHDSKSRHQPTCPYCRQKIQSLAVNQSLKDLIDNFAAQREKIVEGRSKFDEIFDTSKHSESMTTPSHCENSYSMRINASEMRCVILENQLEEDGTELDKLRKRKKGIQSANAHLRKERASAEEKLLLLKEEISLIDTHLHEQQDKLNEVNEKERTIEEGMELVGMSITNIKCEIEKLRMLSGEDDTEGWN